MQNDKDYPTEVTVEYIRTNGLIEMEPKDINRKVRRVNNLSMFQGICHCCDNYKTEDQLKMYIHILSDDHYKKLADHIKQNK